MSADPITPDANLAIMRAAFAALARKDLDGCLAMMAGDFKINIAGMPYQQSGHGPWRKNVEMMLGAFPDLKVEVEDMVASGDRVAVLVRFSGTQQGEFMGVRPTGKRIDYQSGEFYRFADGKIAEEWIISDTLTMMTQVGAVSSSALIVAWLGSFRFWFVGAAGALLGGGATWLLVG